MMNRNSYHRLFSRGRKAGLNSQELTQALTTRPVTGEEQTPLQADCDGDASEIDSRGYQLCRQVGRSPSA